MKLMTYKEALARACRGYPIPLAEVEAEVLAEARKWARHKGTVPFNNMIRALHLLPHRNDRNDWIRLAAALKVRHARKGALA